MSGSNQSNSKSFTVGIYPTILVGVSLVAIVAAFVMANSFHDYESKSKGFSAIIVTFLITCFVVHYWNNRHTHQGETADNRRRSEAAVNEKLFVIEEAGEYFGGSVKSADVFRLVSNKVNEIVPFTAIALFVIDRSSRSMRIVHAQGENADKLRNVETDFETGVAGRCYQTELVQIDRGMMVGTEPISAEALAGVRSSAAVPLIRSGEVFAILQLYSDSRTAFDGNAITLLEAVGERVTPLIFSSLSFERSVSNALTDPVTELPNERAFHMILENQIAESQRNRDGRPLTVLAIDLREFEEINGKYGHATGDRMLSTVAHAIRGQLRQMDFFARASNDEFLAILPTANEAIAEDVIGRIKSGLLSTQFFVNDNQSIQPELNFGVAAFGRDGETAEPLILAARLRKQHAKTDVSQQVLWFPRDLVN